MNVLENWGQGFTESLLSVWYGVLDFLPGFVGAIAIFILGWLLATLIEKLVEGIFKSFKVDTLLKSTGVEDVIERSGHTLNSGKFVGALIKWFVITVFLVASFNVLHLTDVNLFLNNVVLSYLPQVIIAVLVLMVAVVIADVVQKFVTASVRAAHIKSALLLGAIAKWAILIFAVLIAMDHLQIGAYIVNTVFMGIVAGAALAFGLSFGLGGRDVASKMLEKGVHTLSDKE